MKSGNTRLGYRFARHTRRAILTQALAWAFAPALLAGSSAWTALGIEDTGLKGISVAAVSSNGEIYSGAFEATELGPCPTPTLTIGSTAPFSSCVTKTSASGRQVFSVQIAGAGIQAMALDPAGNVYIAGSTGSVGAPVFVATPGAYKSSPTNRLNSFVCELSNLDGHPLFCTFVDVGLITSSASLSSTPGFGVDSAGNTYLAGFCGDFEHICGEKLNPTGTARAYLTSLKTNPSPSPNFHPAYIAFDATGNMCIAHSNVGIATLNGFGSVVGAVTDLGTDLPVGLASDSAGNPQILLQDAANVGDLHMRRYTPDLSAVLFETRFFAGRNPTLAGMGIDPSGIAYAWGSTAGINLTPVHATQVCYPPTPPPQTPTPSAFLARFGNHGEVLQLTYLDIPPNLVTGSPIQFVSTGASVLYFGVTLAETNLKVLKLGPAFYEITLSCIGNGASFTNMPLAPNEIVSLFGTDIGPVQPIFAQPDASGIFPFQLGGTQVTFDGVPAPLLYAGNGQVNLVTPHSLLGKAATHVCAVLSNVRTNCIDMPVQPAAPGILSSGFLRDGHTPYAAAVNQDGTINSGQNPAPAGSVVSLFVTGLGAVTPPPPDGSITSYPLPSQDLKATVVFFWNGIDPSGFFETDANVPYAGPAPLELEGVGQINVVVPPALPPGLVIGGPFIYIEVSLPNGGRVSSSGVALWTK